MHMSVMLSWIFVQHCKLYCSLDREDLGKPHVASGLWTSTAWIHWWSEVVAWHSPEVFSWSFWEWQDRCAEREWQCTYSSEHRVDVKPRGLGNTVCVKISEARWMSLGICRGHGKQMYFHYTDTYACQVTLPDWFWCIGLAEPVGGKF